MLCNFREILIKEGGCLFSNSRFFTVTIIYQLQLAALNMFLKVKAIWILQPIAYGGGCFIQTGGGKGLNNMGTHLGLIQS